MKTERKMYSYRLKFVFAVLLIIIGFTAKSKVQNEKTIEKSIDVKFRPKVTLDIYDTRTEIFPSKDQTITVRVDYTLECDEDEVVKKIESEMENNIIKITGNEVLISDHFFSFLTSWTVLGFKNKTSITFNDGEKLSPDQFAFQIVKVSVYLPDDLDLNVKNKYGSIDLKCNIQGDLNIEGYDIDMTGKGVTGKLNIDAKYSKFSFSSVSGSIIKLYESRFEADETKDVSIDSKYSEINLSKAGTVQYVGYEDKVAIDKTLTVSIDSKYSDLTFVGTGNIKAFMYEGSLKSDTSPELIFDGKYVEITLGEIDQLNMKNAYENKISIQEVKSIDSQNARYDEYNVDKLTGSLNLEGYEEHIIVGSVGPDFSNISIDGKYMESTFTIAKKANYKLLGKVNYLTLNIDPSEYERRLIDKSDSMTQFEYDHGNDKNMSKQVKINGYECKVTIKHQ